MTLLNHIGILLLTIVALNIIDFMSKRPVMEKAGWENKLFPTFVAFALFIVFEIIYWIIKFFF